MDDLKKIFGRLTIIGEPFRKFTKNTKQTFVIAICECGVKKEYGLRHLKNGQIKSCGCLSTELKRARITHGLTDKHPLYSVWLNMKNRCYRKNLSSYKDYGGRGIIVFDEWKKDFKIFTIGVLIMDGKMA